ncbi:MAG: hypothetical protein IJN63_03500 [Clostridia bacterium]|nr:hypothetical protein [Clostridia bacterium]
MKNAIYIICGASLLCSLLGVLSPNGGMGKFVSFVISLVMLAVVFSAVSGIDVQLFAELPEIENNGFSSAEWLVEQSAKEIGRSVSEYLNAKYEMTEAKISVTVDDVDINAIVLCRVTVDLRGTDAVRGVHEAETELESLLGCEVEVLVD